MLKNASTGAVVAGLKHRTLALLVSELSTLHAMLPKPTGRDPHVTTVQQRQAAPVTLYRPVPDRVIVTTPPLGLELVNEPGE